MDTPLWRNLRVIWMSIKNILITSAGRRVRLVQNFQETLKKFNKSGKVFTADMNPFLSSACQISDGFIKVPRVTDKDYPQVLMKFCKENDISVIVPTIDTELHILAKVKEEFIRNGVFIAVSSLNICETFYLKKSTENFFKKYGFNTPMEINDLKNATYPVFAKLNNSSCSIGAQIVYSFEKANELLKENENYVFQEYIKGEEYTVDVFMDRNQNVISVVPRLRLEVRAGEVSKAKTVKDREIINEVKKLCKYLQGAYGTLTIQLFKTKDKIFFIEINPRFGGGYPLTWLSGADFARYLILDFLKEKLSYNENWKDNLVMLRYDAEVLVKGIK